MKIFKASIAILSLLLLNTIVLTIVGTSAFEKANAQPACTAQLSFAHYLQGQGPPTIYTSDAQVQVRNGDTYSLNYRISNGDQQCFGVYQYRILFQDSPPPIVSGNTGGQIVDSEQALGGAVIGQTYKYTLQITNTNNFDNPDASKSLAITFTDGGIIVPPTTPAGDYLPREVKTCQFGSTTARICWKTKAPSNSEIVYGKESETLDPDKSPPDKAGTTFNNTDNHFLNLSGLTPNTTYKYVVRSSPNANTTSTKSGEHSFTTKKTDGTGGNPGGPTNTNTGNPNANINTNVGVTFGDLDQSLGSFFNPLNAKTLPEIITALIRILFVLISIVSVIVIIVAGFRMVLASGNEEQLTKAKKAITWAIVGLIVSLMAFSIVAIIQRLIQVGT